MWPVKAVHSGPVFLTNQKNDICSTGKQMSRNLRISLATETYFPQVNGVSRTLDHLVRHCSEQGDRVQLLLPNYDQNSVQLPSPVEKREWGSLALPFYQEVVLPMVTVGMIERALSAFDLT